MNKKIAKNTAIAESKYTTESLSNFIDENIETINKLKKSSERHISISQRYIENFSGIFSKPIFLYILLLVISIWMTFNLLPNNWNVPHFDPPPFEWLDKSISLGSLFMTVGLLVRQNRQEQMSEQRSELSLQLNLLSEQKIAKLISLVEELRKDLPNVQNRLDKEAEIMTQKADPRQVAYALKQSLERNILKDLSEKKWNQNSTHPRSEIYLKQIDFYLGAYLQLWIFYIFGLSIMRFSNQNN